MPTIAILGTGGTIACVHDDRGDLVPTLKTNDLLKASGYQGSSRVVCKDIMQLDSSSITLADIDLILSEIQAARSAGADAVIVLHGTDSMEETALAADRLIPGPTIFTGAQRPADDPSPDGPANILGAVHAAERSGDSETGALIHFGGVDVPAFGATKWHTTDERAFDSLLQPGDTPPKRSFSQGNTLDGASPLDGLKVNLVYACAGADGHGIDPAADGLVIAGMGSGNIPAAMMPAVESFAGPILVSTRVPYGSVDFIYGGSGGGSELLRIGARSAGSLSPAQARMLLLCELAEQRAAESAD